MADSAHMSIAFLITSYQSTPFGRRLYRWTAAWPDRTLTRPHLGLTDLILCEILQGIPTKGEPARTLKELRRFAAFANVESSWLTSHLRGNCQVPFWVSSAAIACSFETGRQTSTAKASAARANGAKGGRPRRNHTA